MVIPHPLWGWSGPVCGHDAVLDGDNDLTYQYDLAERLTQVRQTGGACVTTDNGTGPLCLKSFTYATSNGTNAAGLTDYRRGKVTSASRYNYVGAPFSATVEVKETYEYAGRGGRISQKDTQQIFNGSANYEAFRQTFTWDELGALASQTYPDCIASTICDSTSEKMFPMHIRGPRLNGKYAHCLRAFALSGGRW